MVSGVVGGAPPGAPALLPPPWSAVGSHAATHESEIRARLVLPSHLPRTPYLAPHTATNFHIFSLDVVHQSRSDLSNNQATQNHGQVQEILIQCYGTQMSFFCLHLIVSWWMKTTLLTSHSHPQSTLEEYTTWHRGHFHHTKSIIFIMTYLVIQMQGYTVHTNHQLTTHISQGLV